MHRNRSLHEPHAHSSESLLLIRKTLFFHADIPGVHKFRPMRSTKQGKQPKALRTFASRAKPLANSVLKLDKQFQKI